MAGQPLDLQTRTPFVLSMILKIFWPLSATPTSPIIYVEILTWICLMLTLIIIPMDFGILCGSTYFVHWLRCPQELPSSSPIDKILLIKFLWIRLIIRNVLAWCKWSSPYICNNRLALLSGNQSYIRLDQLINALPVDIITKKEIIGVGWIAALVKMPEQILVLAMDVSTDVDRRTQLHHHWLLQENLSWQRTQLTNMSLWQLDLVNNITQIREQPTILFHSK